MLNSQNDLKPLRLDQDQRSCLEPKTQILMMSTLTIFPFDKSILLSHHFNFKKIQLLKMHIELQFEHLILLSESRIESDHERWVLKLISWQILSKFLRLHDQKPKIKILKNQICFFNQKYLQILSLLSKSQSQRLK